MNQLVVKAISQSQTNKLMERGNYSEGMKVGQVQG